MNVARSMIERHYHGAHEVVCITDDPEGIDPRVRCVPISNLFAGLTNPLGPEYPSCYRRLAGFRADFADIAGPRYVSCDLDMVIVDDITPLWNRSEDFVIWKSAETSQPYNGSMWLHRTGTRQELYLDFNPVHSPTQTRNARLIGSDQGWIGFRCPNEATWSLEDGVVSWRLNCRNRNYLLPQNARIVFFPGAENPWHDAARAKAPWIEEHYR